MKIEEVIAALPPNTEVKSGGWQGQVVRCAAAPAPARRPAPPPPRAFPRHERPSTRTTQAWRAPDHPSSSPADLTKGTLNAEVLAAAGATGRFDGITRHSANAKLKAAHEAKLLSIQHRGNPLIYRRTAA